MTGRSTKLSLHNFTLYCDSLIYYPKHPLISPYITTVYNKTLIIESFTNTHYNISLQNRTPHLYCLMDRENQICINETLLKTYPYPPFDYLHYGPKNNVQAIDFTNSYMCSHSNEKISRTRLNNGFYDCLFKDDELNNITYSISKKYHYRCESEVPVQYVSIQQLGDGSVDCMDGSDELSTIIDWQLVQCDSETNYACRLLQNGEGSTAKLSLHLYCNSLWDMKYGLDEQNCSKWVCRSDDFQCKNTGQCINRKWVCDDEWDCANGFDELNCPIMNNKSRFILEDLCDDKTEHFCITKEFISDQIHHKPCVQYTRAGDHTIDCIGGRDERNTVSCFDGRMLGDRFRCSNGTCINHEQLCDGLADCTDGDDEKICYWNKLNNCSSFPCFDGRCAERCTTLTSKACSQSEQLLWCPKLKTVMSVVTSAYRAGKVISTSNYNEFCDSSTHQPHLNTIQDDVISKRIDRQFHGYCNRGFYLLTNQSRTARCFCAPPYFGDQCQFSSRRITSKVRINRLHRSDLPFTLFLLVQLICNDTTIIDHSSFVHVIDDNTKFHNYLLYSRTKLEICLYSVRYEAFYVKKTTVELLAVWQYSIMPFNFLPSYRLAKIFNFPNDVRMPLLCTANLCFSNGTCYLLNNNQSSYFCYCQRGWRGRHCELVDDECSDNIRCAPDSVCRGNAICLCKQGYSLPNCFIQNN
ncbi:unnamed protein product, partial [Didymodactylos carnosus]